MNITITLTDAQTKALLSQYVTIGGYAQTVIENRANQIIEQIVKDNAENIVGVTNAERATIDAAVAGKLFVDSRRLPEAVKQIIVKRAPIKTMIEKVAAQVLAETDLVKAPIAK